jgi:hypothetical protein
MLLWMMMICDVMTIMKKDDSSKHIPEKHITKRNMEKMEFRKCRYFYRNFGIGNPIRSSLSKASDRELRTRISYACKCTLRQGSILRPYRRIRARRRAGQGLASGTPFKEIIHYTPPPAVKICCIPRVHYMYVFRQNVHSIYDRYEPLEFHESISKKYYLTENLIFLYGAQPFMDILADFQ